MFKIIPSIDIKDGKGVNLIVGNQDQIIEQEISPLESAIKLKQQGFEYLHIVDINGIFDGIPKNTRLIEEIFKKTKLKIQVTGGIRSLETAQKYIDMGIKKLILGTIAVNDSEMARTIISKFDPVHFGISIDVIKGYASTGGWIEGSNVSVKEMISYYSKLGVSTYIVKEKNIEGIQKLTQIKQTKEIKDYTNTELLISGGINDIKEIEKIKQIGLDGVILGRSLYENKIPVDELLKL